MTVWNEKVGATEGPLAPSPGTCGVENPDIPRRARRIPARATAVHPVTIGITIIVVVIIIRIIHQFISIAMLNINTSNDTSISTNNVFNIIRVANNNILQHRGHYHVQHHCTEHNSASAGSSVSNVVKNYP